MRIGFSIGLGVLCGDICGYVERRKQRRERSRPAIELVGGANKQELPNSSSTLLSISKKGSTINSYSLSFDG